jgi:RNA polymerase sigma-70 factor (ECF subfamily)
MPAAQKTLTVRGSEPRFPRAVDRRGEFEAEALPHLPSLHNLALRLSRNEKDAEDLVQDTYLRAYRFFHRFEPGTNIRAWLFRILRNQFFNRVQQERPEASALNLDDLIDSGAVRESAFPHAPARTPEQEVIDSMATGEIEEALASLPAEYRLVVTLALNDEMSYKEISKALRIPMGTVMSRLHRGRKILQTRLYDYASRRRLIGRNRLESISH